MFLMFIVLINVSPTHWPWDWTHFFLSRLKIIYSYPFRRIFSMFWKSSYLFLPKKFKTIFERVAKSLAWTLSNEICYNTIIPSIALALFFWFFFSKFRKLHAFFISNVFFQLSLSVAKVFHEFSCRCCLGVAYYT